MAENEDFIKDMPNFLPFSNNPLPNNYSLSFCHSLIGIKIDLRI
jgi:hypothetical protein